MDLCDRGDTSIIYYKVVIEFFLSGLDSGHQIPKLDFFCHKTIKIKNFGHKASFKGSFAYIFLNSSSSNNNNKVSACSPWMGFSRFNDNTIKGITSLELVLLNLGKSN